jgi:hypothetical protein
MTAVSIQIVGFDEDMRLIPHQSVYCVIDQRSLPGHHGQVIDLMQALKESLEKSKPSKKAAPLRRRKGRVHNEAGRNDDWSAIGSLLLF